MSMVIYFYFLSYCVVEQRIIKFLRMLGYLQRQYVRWAHDAIATQHPLPVCPLNLAIVIKLSIIVILCCHLIDFSYELSISFSSSSSQLPSLSF